MPSGSPRSPRPRAERRSGSRRIDEAWTPGTVGSPPSDGAGAAALDELSARLRENAPEPEAEAPKQHDGDRDLPELIDDLRAASGAPPLEDEDDE